MRNYNIVLSIFAAFFVFSFSSCTDYDDKAYAVSGLYDAHVVNGAYTFDLSISLDGNDNVLIEGIFDDYDWEIIRADLDDRNDGRIDFDIHSQNIYGGFEIWGDGVYDDGYLQLDYKIDWGYETVIYRIVGSQF